MADTTLANVLLIAPELKGTLTSDRFSLLLSDAKMEITRYSLVDEVIERTQRYLVAHYATLNATNIIKKKIDTLEMAYGQYKSGDDLESTLYGKEVKRILSLYAVDTTAKASMTFKLFS